MIDVALVGTGRRLLPSRWLASYGRPLWRAPGAVRLRRGHPDLLAAARLGAQGHRSHPDQPRARRPRHGLPGLLLTQANSGRTESGGHVGPRGDRRGGCGVARGGTGACRSRCAAAPGVAGGLRRASPSCGSRASRPTITWPCLAYRLDVPRGRRLSPGPCSGSGRAAVPDWKRLQRGERVGERNGSLLTCSGPPRRGPGQSDWSPIRGRRTAIAELVAGVDLLVCEGTFGSGRRPGRAVERQAHDLPEAATARDNGLAPGSWCCTHFSPSVIIRSHSRQSARGVSETHGRA